MSTALNLDIQTSNEWHVLKGDVKYGPYTYADVLKMMQENILFNFDYVWSPHLDSWTSIAELPEFTAERIAIVAQKNKPSGKDTEKNNESPFNNRKNERIMCKLPVFVNDNFRMWSGVAENLSEGGALILMENPILLPGHIVSVHFRNVEGAIPFNCTAEVINKRLTKQRLQHNTGIYYAIRFLQVGKDGVGQIEKWIKEHNTKATKE
jgi:hypothetical protein